MKQLDNFNYACRWTTHIGCVKSCLDYLGVEMTDAWLFGGTGHAFVLNIAPDVCPSGPTAWKYTMLFDLADGLGYHVNALHARKSQPQFAEVQKRAYEMVKQSIDKGVPCYGWELEIPEFYIVHGYDESGYYYKGVMAEEEGKGPKPWQELGKSDIGFIEMYTVEKGQPADDATVVKAAFEAALKHASGTSEWILDGYYSGLAGYDAWIKEMEQGTDDRGGLAYNAAVWAECRRNAVDFLKEAQGRLNGKTQSLFEQAIGHYETVSEQLNTVEKLYPFSPDQYDKKVAVDETSAKAVAALKAAREAEACGLDMLKELVAVL